MWGKEQEKDNQIRTERKLHCFFLGSFCSLDLKRWAHCSYGVQLLNERQRCLVKLIHFIFHLIKAGNSFGVHFLLTQLLWCLVERIHQ
jgi:hypothetical protein